MVFGSISMDLTTYASRLPRPGETLVGSSFQLAPGGKGANQAAAASRLGVRTTFVGRVGDDPFGRQVVEALQGYGVDTSGTRVDPQHATGLAVISVDSSGENAITIIPGANGALDESDVARAERALPPKGALLLQLEVPLESNLELAQRAAQADLRVVLDPAPAPDHPLPESLLGSLYAITPNEGEAAALVGFPIDSPEAAERAARRFLAQGVQLAVIKLGERGAYFADADQAGLVPPFQVEVVDSVAAGDAFNGAFAAALLEGRPASEAVRWGAAAGALAVTRRGAMPSMPSRDELETLLREQPPSSD